MKRVHSVPAVVYAAAVAAAIAGIVRFAPATQAQTQKTAPPSNRPDTPFKLATFDAGGRVRIGLTSGARLVDIAAANTYVAQQAGLPAQTMPGDMVELLE